MSMAKFKLIATVAKSVGYMAYGFNQIFRLAGNAAKKMGDAINDRPLYNIMLVDKNNGEIVQEFSRVTNRKVTDVLDSLDKLNQENFEIKVTINE
tara:strand:- start:5559 stop:5843 length:285 start_codon:yes stop_codon:yes gene_type:complete